MRPELIEQQLVHHGIDVGLVLDGEMGPTHRLEVEANAGTAVTPALPLSSMALVRL